MALLPARRLVGARPAFLWALGAAAAAAALALAWPSRDERIQNRLVAALASPAGRRGARALQRDIVLAGDLRRQGDRRGVGRLVERLLAEPGLDADGLDLLVESTAGGAFLRNGPPPRWEDALVRRWWDSRPGRPSRLPPFYEKEKVRILWRGPTSGPLYLGGNWDAQGMLSNVGGWKDVAMTEAPPGSGRWEARLELARTRRRHLYHASVRTAPWPAGVEVAAGAFAVRGSTTVSLGRVSAGRPLPAAGGKGRGRSGVALVGVDGATWQAIIPLVRRGELPNFARFLREGAWGELESAVFADDYIASLPNIYGVLTGKLPFRHRMGKDYLGLNFSRRASPLWMMASDRGLEAAAVSMWGTFPPDRIRGTVLTEAFFALNAGREQGALELAKSPEVLAFAGAFGVSPRNIRRLLLLLSWIDGAVSTTFPFEVGEALRSRLPNPQLSAASGVEGLTRFLDRQVVSAVGLLSRERRFDLLCLYLSFVDYAAHMHWDELEPYEGGPPKDGTLLAAHREADRLLGLAMEEYRTVVLFSDHGFGAAPNTVIGMLPVPQRILESYNRRTAKPLGGRVESYQQAHECVLWFASAPREEVEALGEALRGTRYLPGGQTVFSQVKVSREEGKTMLSFVHPPPGDIPYEALEFMGGRVPAGALMDAIHIYGRHLTNGVVALWGAGVRPGRLPEARPVEDVAPTVLRLLALPIAQDMDGRAIEEALDVGADGGTVKSYGSGGSGWKRLYDAIRWRKLLRG